MQNSSQGVHERTSRRSTQISPVDLARVRDWVEREIVYVDHPLFTQKNADLQLAKLRPASLDQPSVSSPLEPGIAFVSGMVEAALLTHAEEIYLFTWMNHLKCRAERNRQRLCLNSPDLSLIRKIEADLAEAQAVRNQIVKCNLRLLVSLAKKLAASMDQMAELISEATIPLIRAVELFDVSLGNRFSTYATWAVRNQMLRSLKRSHQIHKQMFDCDQCVLSQVADARGNPDDDLRQNQDQLEQVERILVVLTERERWVVAARFGLDGQARGQSLQEIAVGIGLSKERVRQILIRAIGKLQGMVPNTLLKKVPGTLEASRTSEKSDGPESSRYLFQQTANPV